MAGLLVARSVVALVASRVAVRVDRRAVALVGMTGARWVELKVERLAVCWVAALAVQMVVRLGDYLAGSWAVWKVDL